MTNDLHRINIEYKLCIKIMEDYKICINELKVILNKQNGYKYNENPKKIIKHFPASENINYDDHNSKAKTRDCSFSLSSKPPEAQIDNFLSTATRRYNLLNTFSNDDELLQWLSIKHLYKLPILSPLDLRYNLVKYKNSTEIKLKYPKFFSKDDRSFYDTIYVIKTENPHLYINTNKAICDNILICCNGKSFNIMFESDTLGPYCHSINKYQEQLIREMFNDKNV